MNLSSVASASLWAVLIGESVMALALLLAAITFRLRHPKHLRQASEFAAAILAEMQRVTSGEFVLGSRKILCWIDELKAMVAKRNDGFSSVLRYLLSPQAEHAGAESVIALHLGQMERGAIRLCGFLAKTAPLAGLGGTLVGVSEALNAFAASPGEPAVVIKGFATAIDTTLVGILITFVCLGTSRLIWEPLLTKTVGELMEHVLLLKSHLAELRSKIVPISPCKVARARVSMRKLDATSCLQHPSLNASLERMAKPTSTTSPQGHKEPTDDQQD